jgi:polysaccharide chain length determinant protein (PEP-CTERM system associated)
VKNNDGSKSPMAMLRVLKRRKLVLLIPILVLTPLVAAYALRLPQRFRARALVGTTQMVPGSSALTPRTEIASTLTAQDQVRAIRETLFNPGVLEGVIREFQLADLSHGAPEQAELDAIKSRIQIQVESPEAFYIGFDSPQREQSMQVANRLAGLFIERISNARGQRVEREDNFLDNEVERLRQQLSEQENKLIAYKSSAAAGLPERLTANLKQMETLQQQIQAKTDQITELEARRASMAEELRSLEGQGILEPEPAAKTNAEINLEQAQLKLSELRTKYTPEHPEIQRAEKQVRDMQAQAARTPAATPNRRATPVQMRYVSLQAEMKSVEPRLNSYRRERELLSSQLRSYEGRVNAAPGFETALSERMRDASLTRTRYEALLAKQQEAKLAHRVEKVGAAGPTYRIIEPAQLPAAPSSLSRRTIILFGFLASLGIGLLGVVLTERMNPTFESAEEMAKFTNLPVFASVPNISERLPKKHMKPRKDGFSGPPAHPSEAWITPEQKKHFQEHRLTTLFDPHSVASQQYSILALKIQHWMHLTGARTLMVTSASGEEGKSVTAVNLSLALASTLDGKVLLIDGDLRLPQVQTRLGLKGDKGFGDVLSQPDADVRAHISKVGNLDVLTGGTLQGNPAGLLASQRTRDLLSKLREDYKLIVLDSPPIVPIADGHIIAGLSDGVLFVVRARMTRPELFQRGVESLGAANVIGVVLNDVELAATPYAYAYQYYQKHYLGRS